MAKRENGSTEEVLRQIIRQELNQQAAQQAKFLKDIGERLEVVEDAQSIIRKDGDSRVILSKKLYDADMDEILEVTKLPYSVIDASVDLLTLEAVTDPDVLSGRVSLARKGLDYLFRLLLSPGGWNRRLAIEALIAQESKMEGEAEVPTSAGEAP